MSTNIIGRVDEMGKRIDDIEKSINEIMNDLGEEDEPKASKWIRAPWLVSSPTLLFKYIKTYIAFYSNWISLA